MSKESKVVNKEVKNNEVESQVRDVSEPKDKAAEAIEVLRVQLQNHSQKAEEHKTMAIKAQGALEVLLQLHPQDNSGEGS